MTSALSNGGNKKRQYICIRCGFNMIEISTCHLKCFNCGAEYDCTDKGIFW